VMPYAVAGLLTLWMVFYGRRARRQGERLAAMAVQTAAVQTAAVQTAAVQTAAVQTAAAPEPALSAS
jgi:hypothetical protein